MSKRVVPSHRMSRNHRPETAVMLERRRIPHSSKAVLRNRQKICHLKRIRRSRAIMAAMILQMKMVGSTMAICLKRGARLPKAKRPGYQRKIPTTIGFQEAMNPNKKMLLASRIIDRKEVDLPIWRTPPNTKRQPKRWPVLDHQVYSLHSGAMAMEAGVPRELTGASKAVILARKTIAGEKTNSHCRVPSAEAAKLPGRRRVWHREPRRSRAAIDRMN